MVDFDERGNMFVNGSQVQGSLHDNVQHLLDVVKTLEDGAVKQHMISISKVGMFIINNGPVVKTQDVGQVYIVEKKLASTRKKSMELYNTLAKHLNLVQIYVHNTAYLTENSCNLSAVFQAISTVFESNSEVWIKKFVQDRVQPPSYALALKYLATEIDRS